jgi:hypothetical protein
MLCVNGNDPLQAGTRNCHLRVRVRVRYENWGEDFLQLTVLRFSTRLVNVMNIVSCEGHDPLVCQKMPVLL